MANCKACGVEIEWIKTRSGKSMPVNPSEFPLIPDKAGNVFGVIADGEVMKGRTCSESYEAERWVYARISHFATCPKADSMRRKEG